MIEIGDIVVSKAGHDEGRMYVVTSQKGEDFVLVADGKYRKFTYPKLKRKKHLKRIGHTIEVETAIVNGQDVDARLVFELKKIEKNI